MAVAQEANARSRRVLERIGVRHERDVVMWDARQRFYVATGKERG